jgi:pimeloyl-ACP methyl ester carboxylesterase
MDDLNMERTALMGHSLGAYIALAFAARYPERADRVVAVDGGGALTEAQFEKVFAAIGPAVARLGREFPSVAAYLTAMKSVDHILPWNRVLETYCYHEIQETGSGVRCSIDPEHIAEEARNLGEEKPGDVYPKIACPTLIIRSSDGIIDLDDLVLPDSAVEKMVQEIRETRVVTVQGANHYGIVFQPHSERDRAIREFLAI